jgi:hypothetical protein
MLTAGCFALHSLSKLKWEWTQVVYAAHGSGVLTHRVVKQRTLTYNKGPCHLIIFIIVRKLGNTYHWLLFPAWPVRTAGGMDTGCVRSTWG